MSLTPRKYGADRFGFEATSVEALRRAQRFRVGGARKPDEDLSEPVGDFTLAEYMEAFMENTVRNITSADRTLSALATEHAEGRIGDTPLGVDVSGDAPALVAEAA